MVIWIYKKCVISCTGIKSIGCQDALGRFFFCPIVFLTYTDGFDVIGGSRKFKLGPGQVVCVGRQTWGSDAEKQGGESDNLQRGYYARPGPLDLRCIHNNRVLCLLAFNVKQEDLKHLLALPNVH